MSSRPQKGSRNKAVPVALLLLCYAAAVSASAGLETSQTIWQVVALQFQPTSSGTASFFVGAQGQVPSEPTGEGQFGPPSGLPSLPEPQPSAGTDAMYILDGGSYLVFPVSGPNEGAYPTALQSPAVLPVWMAQGARRSRFRIYIEILDALKGGPMTPFEIAFRLRLNSKRAKGYVVLLVERGLAERAGESDFRVSLTASGRTFADDVRKAFLLD